MEQFIPLLSKLFFITKKHEDFLDFVFIGSVLFSGKHTTKSGRALLKMISKKMNSNRLSSEIANGSSKIV